MNKTNYNNMTKRQIQKRIWEIREELNNLTTYLLNVVEEELIKDYEKGINRDSFTKRQIERIEWCEDMAKCLEEAIKFVNPNIWDSDNYKK